MKICFFLCLALSLAIVAVQSEPMEQSSDRSSSTEMSHEEEEEEGDANPDDSKGVLVEDDIREDESKYKSGADQVKFWPEGKVYFKIDKTRLSVGLRKNISEAMRIIQSKTQIKANCIQFFENTYKIRNRNYVFLTSKDGCWSRVGMKGGMQVTSLGPGCGSIGRIIHELLHVLGFYHEQSRSDRDRYITIIWKNILSDYSVNFHKRNDKIYKMKYDLESIMHYQSNAFSKNEKLNTIEVKGSAKRGMLLGQRKHLSAQDIYGIKKAYKCTAQGSGISAKVPSTTAATTKQKYTIPASGRSSFTRPTISRRRPITIRRPPVTTRRPPVTTRRPPVTTRRSPITARRKPVTTRRPPVTTRRPP
ncbi:unnamed protein product, partial [Owenia fusiformis]